MLEESGAMRGDTDMIREQKIVYMLKRILKLLADINCDQPPAQGKRKLNWQRTRDLSVYFGGLVTIQITKN